jgi:hypothetical protein
VEDKQKLINQDLKDQEKLCQFEKLKEWKTGFSVKCPESTATIYVNKGGRSDMLHYWIEAKRSSTCSKCDKKEGMNI